MSLELSVANMTNLVLCVTEVASLWFLTRALRFLYGVWPRGMLPLFPPAPPILPLNPPPPHLPLIPIQPSGCPDIPTGIQARVSPIMACERDPNTGQTHEFYSSNMKYLYQATCAYVNPNKQPLCSGDQACELPMFWTVSGQNRDTPTHSCGSWRLDGATAQGTIELFPNDG